MKKVALGFAAVGAVVAARPFAQRLARRMHRRCEQMIVRLGDRGEAAAGT